ncbi:hypothetical protein P7K49_002673 [Saguinus oedipus]|uniref:Uncharacterized protein n=1 Tax=Saguinus oedipus TaxID=9490 RepID=A0ABQ9WI02_SAGOE|nr:hypothetical protein P7K49_002673 [Saguinus oedipus]
MKGCPAIQAGQERRLLKLLKPSGASFNLEPGATMKFRSHGLKYAAHFPAKSASP